MAAFCSVSLLVGFNLLLIKAPQAHFNVVAVEHNM